MKRYFSIWLIIAIMLPSVSKLAVIARFEWNRDYIAKTFCENKDKPSMHCEGKCFLQKELRKQEEGEKTLPELLKEKQEIIFCLNYLCFDFKTIKSFLVKAVPYLIKDLPIQSFDIFHPPQ